MYLYEAEDDALADVGVRVAHEDAERVGQLQHVLYQKRKMMLADVGTARALIYELLDVAKLVLHHAEQGLEPGRLLLAEQRLDCNGEELRVAGDDEPLEEVLGHLVRDALVLWRNIRRVCPKCANQNVLPVLLEDRGACPNLLTNLAHCRLRGLYLHLVPVPLL